jgi:hypothetical protein
VTAARTLLLFYRHALNENDALTADAHRTDVEMIRYVLESDEVVMLMRHYRLALAQSDKRFKIGHHHAQLIEYFLDRAGNPTFEKLSAHYPEHPRHGA